MFIIMYYMLSCVQELDGVVVVTGEGGVSISPGSFIVGPGQSRQVCLSLPAAGGGAAYSSAGLTTLATVAMFSGQSQTRR